MKEVPHPGAVEGAVEWRDILADRVMAPKACCHPPDPHLRSPIARAQPREIEKIERFFVQAAPCMHGFRADLEALAAA